MIKLYRTNGELIGEGGRIRDICEKNKDHLSGANLQNVDLFAANLQQANLSGSILRRADLRRADLRGANFTNADLRGAHFYNTKIDKATNFEGAIMDFETAQYIIRKLDEDK